MGVLALTIGLCGSVDLPRSQGKPLISRAGPSPLQSKDSHLTFMLVLANGLNMLTGNACAILLPSHPIF